LLVGVLLFGSVALRHENLPRETMWTLATLYGIDVAFVNIPA